MTKKDLKIINSLLKRAENLPDIVHLRAAPQDYKMSEVEKKLLLDTYQKLDDILKEVAVFINVKFQDRYDYKQAWNNIDFDTKISGIKINTSDRTLIKSEWKKGLNDLKSLIKTLAYEVELRMDDEKVIIPNKKGVWKRYHIEKIAIGLIITVIGGLILDKITRSQTSENISNSETTNSIPKSWFDENPSNKTGIISISEGYCNECGGLNNELEINLRHNGDSTFVTVFMDFMAKRKSKISLMDVRAYYMTKETVGTSPTFNFFGSLTASNTKRISDFAILKGLPEKYKIEYISGFIQNEHGGKNGCHENYNYNVPTNNDLFSSNGQFLGDLYSEGNGWCAQGTISVKYKITRI